MTQVYVSAWKLDILRSTLYFPNFNCVTMLSLKMFSICLAASRFQAAMAALQTSHGKASSTNGVAPLEWTQWLNCVGSADVLQRHSFEAHATEVGQLDDTMMDMSLLQLDFKLNKIANESAALQAPGDVTLQSSLHDEGEREDFLSEDVIGDVVSLFQQDWRFVSSTVESKDKLEEMVSKDSNLHVARCAMDQPVAQFTEDWLDDELMHMSLLQLNHELKTFGVDEKLINLDHLKWSAVKAGLPLDQDDFPFMQKMGSHSGSSGVGVNNDLDDMNSMLSLLQHRLMTSKLAMLKANKIDPLQVNNFESPLALNPLTDMLPDDLAVSFLQLHVELAPEVTVLEAKGCKGEETILVDEHNDGAQNWNVELLQTSIHINSRDEMQASEAASIAKTFSEMTEDDLEEVLADAIVDRYGSVMLLQTEEELGNASCCNSGVTRMNVCLII